jgi:hypothetical protein
MGLGHEKLDVYRLAMGYEEWVFEKAGALTRIHRPARDQWLRASHSIPPNIAEGNGKTLDGEESQRRKTELDRIAAMLSRLGGRGYSIKDEFGGYGVGDYDPDPDLDSDFDLDEIKSRLQD